MTKRRLQMSCLLSLCVFWGSFRLSHGEHTVASTSLPEPSFLIARGTRRILQTEHFFPSQNISSPAPSLPDENIFLSLSGECSICTAQSHIPAGQIERIDKPSAISTIFTLQQLKSSYLFFQHNFSAGTELVSLTVTVSSTNSSAILSDIITLYIQPFDGNIYVANDSCLLVLEDSTASLQGQHLSASTDFSDQDPTLTYRFESPLPSQGSLEVYQLSQLDSNWVSIETRKQANTISQAEIYAGHVRYTSPSLQTQSILELSFPFQLSSSQLTGPSASLCVVIVPAVKPLLSVETSVIHVLEGQTKVVNASDFHLSLSSQFDLSPWGVDITSESLDLRLVASSLPQFGVLQLDGILVTHETHISFNDIHAGRLMYVHDNSENFADHLVFWLETVSMNNLPLALPDPTYSLQLNFSITPINDNPPVPQQLEPINPLEGSSIIVTSAMIGVSDADLDTPQEDIVISIETSGTLGTPNGHFAYQSDTMNAITEFRYSEILAGLVVFKYGDDLRKELQYVQGAQVSDGIHFVTWAINVSATSINISVTPVKSLGQNCVATIDTLQDQFSFALLDSAFSIEISQEEHLADVIIDIVTPPKFGQMISKEHGQSHRFSLVAVEAGDVEYRLINNKLREELDSMQLQFSVGHGNSSIVDIEICIKTLPYPSLVTNSMIELVEGGLGMLSREFLWATQSRSSESSPAELQYTVKQQPMHGLLINKSTDYTGSSLASFTQADIDNEYIGYLNTEGPNIVSLADSFSFLLSNLYYELQAEYNFSIQMVVTDLKVVDEGFVVRENHTHRLTPEEFYAVAPPGYSVELYIIDQPRDGDLKIQRDNAPLTIEHPQTVDLSDIEDGYLYYVHNGSKGQESAMDNFRFVFLARPHPGSSMKFIKCDRLLNITIELVNDNTPRDVSINPLVVIEGSTTAFTLINLLFTDADAGYNKSLLNYTLTLKPFLGILCLTEEGCAANKETNTWLQSDVSSGRLFYKHNKSISMDPSDSGISSITGMSDVFVFTVSDGLNEMVHNVFIIHILKVIIQRINDQPVYVSEGGAALITPTNMLFTLTGGDNIQSSDYKYQLTNLPNHGFLVWPFYCTGEDVESGNVWYFHDDSNTETDYFTFSVTVDGYEISSNTEYNVQIMISPFDDDEPFLVTKKPLLVFEGPTDFKHFNPDVLEAHDNDTKSAADIVYYIESPPVNGIIQKRPDETADFKSLPVESFTQDDINKMNVRYERTNISSLNDSFSFIIGNFRNGKIDNENPTLYSIDVVILPTELHIKTSGLTVQEGGIGYLTPNNFVVVHPYLANQDYEITFHLQPVHGTLMVVVQGDHVDAAQNRKISTEDLRQHKVYYVHDGSENFADHFTFGLNSMGSEAVVQQFLISIEHVNDHFPMMQNNSLLKLYAGQTVLITPDILLAVDPDLPASTLTYTFTLTPEQQVDGHFAFASTPSQTNLTFTQDDINNGLIVFVDTHDYSGTRNLSFTLTDGNKSIHSIFMVMALEVCLGKELLKPLTVPLGGSVVISNTSLSYVSNGPSDPEEIMYTFSSARYGILTRDGKVETITHFTKAEVNKNIIRYHHVATDVWEAHDVIHLKGSTPLTLRDTHIELNVSIVLPSQPGSLFAADKDLFMSEGETKCLSQSVLDARNFRYHSWKSKEYLYSLNDTFLLYKIHTPSSYGELLIDGVPSSVSSSFTQQQLTDHRVCYSNNGSYEHSHDSVGYTVCVITGNGTILAQLNNTLVMQIHLFNDEKPMLVPSSLLSLNAVLGFPSNITRLMLEVIDRDNSSQEISFFVTKSPANGFLTISGHPVVSFTQADINVGYLKFVPKAAGNFTITFNFTDQGSSVVSTGMNLVTYPPVTFTVTVATHFLNLLTVGTLHYHQNQLGATLTPLVLDSETNGLPSETVFSVSRKPKYGHLLIEGEEVQSFTQFDINRGSVDYMIKPSGVHVSNDSFEVTLSNRDAPVEGYHTVEIVVEARGKIPDSVALEPIMNQPLPSDLLNMREYSLENKNWPTIKITSELQYGCISLYFETRENHYIAVNEFDYSDLEKEVVYYTWFPHQDGIEGGAKYYEVFKGEVVIDGLPPGRFSITLNLTAPSGAAPLPSSPLTQTSTLTALPTSQPSNAGPLTSLFNYSVVLPMVILGIVTGILTCAIVGFCCWQYRKINHKIARKGAGSILSFPSARSRASARHLSPVRLGQSPVLVQASGSGVIHSDTPSLESSTASLEMMNLSQVPHHPTHPATTCHLMQTSGYSSAMNSAGVTPFYEAEDPATTCHPMQSSGYSSAINSAGVTPFYETEDPTQFSDEDYDNIHMSPSLHQASPVPPSNSWYHPSSISPGKTESQLFLRGTDQRASSPVRRLRAASPMRRNSKPYSSMSRVAAGPPATKAPCEFTVDLPQSVIPSSPNLRDSNSSLPCDSSCESKMAENPPIVSQKLVTLQVPNGEDAPRLFRTTHPVLRNNEYWV